MIDGIGIGDPPRGDRVILPHHREIPEPIAEILHDLLNRGVHPLVVDRIAAAKGRKMDPGEELFREGGEDRLDDLLGDGRVVRGRRHVECLPDAPLVLRRNRHGGVPSPFVGEPYLFQEERAAICPIIGS